MKRISILLIALLALVVAACSNNQASISAEPSQSASATQTPEATESEAAEPSEGSSVDGTALTDLVPDELNGAPRTDVPGMDAILGPALAQQGLDPSDAEFIFSTYGEGTDSVAVNAFRVAGMTQPSLEAFARAMAGVDTQGATAETVTVGGKSVLRMAGTDATTGAAYLYFANGAMFTVVSQSEDLAAQLLAELP